MTDFNFEETRKEVAAIGFKAALRLISLHRSLSEEQARDFVSIELGRALEQIRYYETNGISPHLAEKFIKVLKRNRIPFGIHQLRPTKQIVHMHKWRSVRR